MTVKTKMVLWEQYEKIGHKFFKWRSYFPLVIILFFFLNLKVYKFSGQGEGLDWLLEIVCLLVSFLGLAVRMYAVGCVPRGTSGRNVAEQRAASINTTGLYSVTRHPLYLGNFLIWFGVALAVRSWWFLAVTLLVFMIYYERIIFVEEAFLRKRFGNVFLEWSARTPAFFPVRWSNWRAPELQFSFRNALRREYSGFFGIVSIFSVLELVEDIISDEPFALDLKWLTLFLISFMVYITFLVLKKKTSVLDVAGR